MDKIFNLFLEGENIDGDFIATDIEFENYKNFNNAIKDAEEEATEILKNVGGGHIDIFDEDGNFITDVEV